ncbi:Phage major tail protein 2 [compost metagenome]
MACKNPKFVGRDVVVEFSIGCGDALPAELEWRRFGAMRTKEWNLGWDTADATDADIVGYLRENMGTFQTLEVSGDGVLKVSGAGAQNLKDIQKHVANPAATGGQPVAWFRYTFPDLTFISFMIITEFSRSAPYDDVATYSYSASATASDFGLIVEDTPDADGPEPTSVEVAPDALSMAVGQVFDFEAVVLPAGAPQGLRWTSSAPSIASVNQITGEVTALAVGTANITAASSVVAGVTDTVSVTVTAP